MTVNVKRVVLLPLPSDLAHVVDADPRLVVEDRTKSLSVGDGRIHRRAEINGEGFGRLGNPIAEDCDRKRPAGLAGRDNHVAGDGNVIAAGRRGAIYRFVVDRHVHRGGLRECHGERGIDGATVAFGDRRVANGDTRRQD